MPLHEAHWGAFLICKYDKIRKIAILFIVYSMKCQNVRLNILSDKYTELSF